MFIGSFFGFYMPVFVIATFPGIDKEWIKNSLQHDYDRFLSKEINLIDVTRAVENVTAPGCVDKRLNMAVLLENGIKMNTSVILKLPHNFPVVKKIADKIFNTEIAIYRDVLPILEHLNYRLGHNGDLHWVRGYGFKNGQLLLEDVVDEGYKLAVTLKGMDIHQSLISMKALAEFHALSAVANEENNNKIKEQFSESVLERNYDELLNFYELVYINFAEMIEKKWNTEWKTEAKKIRELAPKVKEILLNITIQKDGFINVLNLGSPDFRNTYFIYSISNLAKSSKPLDVKFSNFQSSFFNSPLHDVQHFISISPSLDVQTNHKAELFNQYYDSLINYLKEFSYKGKIPTKKEFNDEVKRTNFIALTTAIPILPFRFISSTLNPPETVEKYGGKQAQNFYINSLYAKGMFCQEYEDYMKVMLKEAVKKFVI